VKGCSAPLFAARYVILMGTAPPALLRMMPEANADCNRVKTVFYLKESSIFGIFYHVRLKAGRGGAKDEGLLDLFRGRS
jgi:hypothetical protein